jgi:hypothetical protein
MIEDTFFEIVVDNGTQRTKASEPWNVSDFFKLANHIYDSYKDGDTVDVNKLASEWGCSSTKVEKAVKLSRLWRGKQSKVNSNGGPSSYYDFPGNWRTWNDLADYKAKNQWLEYSFHLGNIGKAIYRWGEKNVTTKNYDVRKIVYSGLRVLLMMEGKEQVQKYLKELQQDPQFQKEESQ